VGGGNHDSMIMVTVDGWHANQSLLCQQECAQTLAPARKACVGIVI